MEMQGEAVHEMLKQTAEEGNDLYVSTYLLSHGLNR